MKSLTRYSTVLDLYHAQIGFEAFDLTCHQVTQQLWIHLPNVFVDRTRRCSSRTCCCQFFLSSSAFCSSFAWCDVLVCSPLAVARIHRRRVKLRFF